MNQNIEINEKIDELLKVQKDLEKESKLWKKITSIAWKMQLL